MEEPRFLTAVVTDVFSAIGIPTSTANHLLGKLFKRRLGAARDILIEALKAGERTLPNAEVDEIVAILYRYHRAAQEGAARLNLRLMAQTIAGQAHIGNLKADEFLYKADLIASLRREEVLLLAKLHHAWKSDWLLATPEQIRHLAADKWIAEELVPAVFGTVEEMSATLGGLTRTGLVESVPAVETIMYAPTLLLDQLVAFSDLEAAIAKES
jgi:hypothetical protein